MQEKKQSACSARTSAARLILLSVVYSLSKTNAIIVASLLFRHAHIFNGSKRDSHMQVVITATEYIAKKRCISTILEQNNELFLSTLLLAFVKDSLNYLQGFELTSIRCRKEPDSVCQSISVRSFCQSEIQDGYVSPVLFGCFVC